MGTLTGGVYVFGTYSMTQLYHVDKCHKSFVTRLEFMQRCLETEPVIHPHQDLVSISVDNQICLHRIQAAGEYNTYAHCFPSY